MHQGAVVISKGNLVLEEVRYLSMNDHFVSSQENLKHVQMVGHFYEGTVSKILNQKVLP